MFCVSGRTLVCTNRKRRDCDRRQSALSRYQLLFFTEMTNQYKSPSMKVCQKRIKQWTAVIGLTGGHQSDSLKWIIYDVAHKSERYSVDITDFFSLIEKQHLIVFEGVHIEYTQTKKRVLMDEKHVTYKYTQQLSGIRGLKFGASEYHPLMTSATHKWP